MIEFIIQNKEWIFSGIGVAIIVGGLGMFFRKKKKVQNISSGQTSTNIQAGNGAYISVSTNSKGENDLVQKASMEDIKKYDLKTIYLLKKIGKSNIRYYKRPYYGLTTLLILLLFLGMMIGVIPMLVNYFSR